jgi:hypothetical protein
VRSCKLRTAGEIDGRYYDEKNNKKAERLERKAEKQANNLEKKANKLENKGKSSGDLRDRVTELRKSSQDVKDMRNDPVTEYKYANLNSKEAKSLNLEGPTTTITGRNSNNDNIVTMFTEKNVGNQLHENRHGGDVARGDLCFDNEGGYGLSHEVSAYRAQYSYEGSLTLAIGNSNVQNILDIQGISGSTIGNINRAMLDSGNYPIGPVNLNPISNINNINSNLIQNIVEVQNVNGVNYLSWIYLQLK